MEQKPKGWLSINVSQPVEEDTISCSDNSNITIDVPESLKHLTATEIRDLIADAIKEVK